MLELEKTEINPNQELHTQLIECEPKLISDFVPEKQNALDQKVAFLAGNIRNPNHIYNKLDSIDFNNASDQIANIGNQVLSNPYLDKKHVLAYEAFIKRYQNENRLMGLAHRFNNTFDIQEKALIKDEFMDVNVELYCEPDKYIYRSLIQEKLERINQYSLGDRAESIRQELFDITGYNPNNEKIKTYSPSKETVEWMHDVAEALYSGMLSHIPKQEKFTVQDIKTVFLDIIGNEFGGSADDWRVDIENAASIGVSSSEKRIIIPENHIDVNYKEMQKLVVHEIGVHVIRSITGADTDVFLLRNGLVGYQTAEEGIAMIMEQAIDGKYKKIGSNYYITAGLIYFDNKDFRDTFEAKWRMAVLTTAKKSGGEVTEVEIDKAKMVAYDNVMRIMRGTDELPCFRDLAYYNGCIEMWQYFEKNIGDDEAVRFTLMGKTNPASISDQRILYEASTVY